MLDTVERLLFNLEFLRWEALGGRERSRRRLSRSRQPISSGVANACLVVFRCSMRPHVAELIEPDTDRRPTFLNNRRSRT
jgi:hypothetical protein